MARKASKHRVVATEDARAPRKPAIPVIWVGLVAAVAVWHSVPLTSSTASIQWDAVDVHYSAQKYFADSVRVGQLPHWTPYIFSGFPFLADPQTGAWYPLNWPFFLAGVTPRAIQGELALHCLIAVAGAFLLAGRLLGASAPAVVAALAYAMSGFFAGHASHVGMSQTAAWLPWLLLAISKAVEDRSHRWTIAGGVIGGVMILAGHFQTALYSLTAAALWAAGFCVGRRDRLARTATVTAVVATLALLLSAIQVLPGLELTGLSIRGTMNFVELPSPALAPGSLLTMLWPNALGVFGEQYTGPVDKTQHYLYAGMLLLPLAALGLRNSRVRIPMLLLLIPAAWYAIGPRGGLYSIVTLLPGFASIRAPVNVWFVCSLALAILAGAGAATAGVKWKWAAVAIPAVLFVDVCLWNSVWNPLAYARNSFQERYGNGLEIFLTRVGARVPEGSRLHSPYPITTLGPRNHPLDARVESTYGYNPLSLASYERYYQSSDANPKLLDTLGVGLRIHVPDGRLERRTSALPRATFPKRVVAAADARPLLATLDPVESAVTSQAVPTHDGGAVVTSIDRGEQSLRVRYRASAPSLLRIGIPHFPGWRATVAGRDLPVVAVDYALMGVVVPAGEHEVALRFHSRYFALGAAISAVAAILALAGLKFL